MRRLLVLLAVVGVLGVCAPSYGYILVYKLSSTLKMVETDANTMGNLKLKGYLALDIDDVEETVDDAEIVFYGKDGDLNDTYIIDRFQGSADAEWSEEGEFVTLRVYDHLDYYYEIIVTGKIKEKDVGLGVDELRSTAPSLKGSMINLWGILLDYDLSLYGSGSASMTLDKNLTKEANGGMVPVTVNDVIMAIVQGDGGLEDKGYVGLIIP